MLGVNWRGGLEIWIGPPGVEKISRAAIESFSKKNSRRLLQDWVSVPSFGALKYDVRHTPIVIERIAKERTVKADVNP
jgi:hypothetical protein